MESKAGTAPASVPVVNPMLDGRPETDEGGDFDIRIRRDAVNPEPPGVYAYRIDMPRQLRKWKPAVFPQRVESLAIAFVMSLLNGLRGERTSPDFRLWFYALDAEGETKPDHDDYDTFWHGVPLDSAYLILSCDRNDWEVELFLHDFLARARVANPDAFEVPRIPEGAHPMIRFQRGRIASYASPILIDPAAGKVPAFRVPDIARGRVLNRWIRVDLDGCVRRAATGGGGPIRPRMDITRNGEPSGTTMEVRYWYLRKRPARSRKRARKGRAA